MSWHGKLTVLEALREDICVFFDEGLITLLENSGGKYDLKRYDVQLTSRCGKLLLIPNQCLIFYTSGMNLMGWYFTSLFCRI